VFFALISSGAVLPHISLSLVDVFIRNDASMDPLDGTFLVSAKMYAIA
jgi:hypothetical protein